MDEREHDWEVENAELRAAANNYRYEPQDEFEDFLSKGYYSYRDKDGVVMYIKDGDPTPEQEEEEILKDWSWFDVQRTMNTINDFLMLTDITDDNQQTLFDWDITRKFLVRRAKEAGYDIE